MSACNGHCPYGHPLEVLGILGDYVMIYCPNNDYSLFVPLFAGKRLKNAKLLELTSIDRGNNEK